MLWHMLRLPLFPCGRGGADVLVIALAADVPKLQAFTPLEAVISHSQAGIVLVSRAPVPHGVTAAIAGCADKMPSTKKVLTGSVFDNAAEIPCAFIQFFQTYLTHQL